MTRRERDTTGAGRPFDRMDRMLQEWTRMLPTRRPFGLTGPLGDVIRVDEFRDDDTEVIRAELPGLDPEKDIDIRIADGVLRINAERRVEKTIEEKGYRRHELRYGRMSRALPLPRGVTESEITATYKDGILEIRVPVPQLPETEPTKIAVTKA